MSIWSGEDFVEWVEFKDGSGNTIQPKYDGSEIKPKGAMDDDRCVIVDVNLKLNDIYSPFRWERGNVARWVAASVLCLIFLDLCGREFPESSTNPLSLQNENRARG